MNAPENDDKNQKAGENLQRVVEAAAKVNTASSSAQKNAQVWTMATEILSNSTNNR